MPINDWVHGAEVRIVGEMHGVRTQNVFHMASDVTVNDQDALDTVLLQLATAMLECVRDTLLPAVTQDWKCVHVEAQKVFPELSDTILATALPTDVGQLGVTSVSFASTLVNVRTGLGGRTHRGKKFLPPPGEAQIAQSEIDAPTMLLIAQFLICVGAKFMGTAPESQWHFGVFSRKNASNTFANWNAGFALATSLNPVADVARMGSRKVGRGQ